MKSEYYVRYKEMWVVTGFIGGLCKERWLVEAYSGEQAIQQVAEHLKEYSKIIPGMEGWDGKNWALVVTQFDWDDEEKRVWSCGFGDW